MAVKYGSRVGRPASSPGDALTARQAQILGFIRGYIHDNGIPPSLRDIVRHFGLGSTNAVACHLEAIERKGAIKLTGAGKSRGIKVLVGPCPMCGGER
jgi:repressor LexA